MEEEFRDAHQEFHEVNQQLMAEVAAKVSDLLMKMDKQAKKQYLADKMDYILDPVYKVSIQKEDYEVSGIIKEIREDRKNGKGEQPKHYTF